MHPKYHRYLEEHVRLSLDYPKCPETYRSLLHLLTSVHTKRIMFDAKQALVFDRSSPIQVEGVKLKPIFTQFYLEFSEPIKIRGQEPGFEDDLVGMIYVHDGGKVPLQYSDGAKKKDGAFVIFIFFNSKTNQWVDRAFRMNLDEKIALPAVQNVRNTPEPSEVPENWPNNTWYESGLKIQEMPDRKIGWWETSIQWYSELLFWIFAYCMAKSVKVEEEKLSRQQLRWHERNKVVPRPWHYVKVEPKLFLKSQFSEESDREVGYRFDVIGHLRFNKHKLKTGAYRYTIEWVPDHQRGLQHETYIPKTYVVEKGSKVLPDMRQYWGDDAFPKSS